MQSIESVIREEHCMFRLIDAVPENDAVMFVGLMPDAGRIEVITRLDEYGNAKANLGEVTVIVQRSRKGRKAMPPPKFRPLTEVVETVAKHQAAGFSPSTTRRILTDSCDEGKGEVCKVEKLKSLKVEKLVETQASEPFNLSTLTS